MRVSVLDQSGIAEGHEPSAAIRESVRLAQACERFGYSRYWVSEHHNNGAVAGSAPEVLLGALALATSTMRIGSAGIMLPHYAPLKVAEQFRVLEALAPGRVDLGMGRGPGADRQTVYALKPGALDNPLAMMSMDDFPRDVEDVIAWTSSEALPDDHPFGGGIRAQPLGSTVPEHWIVGSTSYTARLAAALGLPYCFAHFFHDGDGAAEALAQYRTEFRPSSRRATAHSALCVWAVAAPNEARAEELFAAYAQWRIERLRGREVPFPDAAQVARASYTAKEQATVEQLRQRVLHGTSDEVASGLRAIAAKYEADELVVITMTHDPADRRRSYELIASAMGLGDAAGTGDASPPIPASQPTNPTFREHHA